MPSGEKSKIGDSKMKQFFEDGKHEGWVEWINGQLTKYSCTCEDFQFRRLQKVGEKVRAIGPCKHIKKVLGVK